MVNFKPLYNWPWSIYIKSGSLAIILQIQPTARDSHIRLQNTLSKIIGRFQVLLLADNNAVGVCGSAVLTEKQQKNF